MQTEIYNRPSGMIGEKANSTPSSGRGATALATIMFGVLCIFANSEMTNCVPAQAQKITLDADLITSNVLAGNVVIDGVSNAVTTTFSANHLTTMNALKTAIELLDSDLVVTVSGTTNRVLSVECKTKSVLLSGFTVTAGLTQAGITYGLANKIAGLAKSEHKERNADGTVTHNLNDTVTIIEKGEYQAFCEDTDIDPNKDDVYVRIVPESGKTLGAIKKSADSGKAVAVTKVRFASTVQDGMVTLALDI